MTWLQNVREWRYHDIFVAHQAFTSPPANWALSNLEFTLTMITKLFQNDEECTGFSNAYCRPKRMLSYLQSTIHHLHGHLAPPTQVTNISALHLFYATFYNHLFKSFSTSGGSDCICSHTQWCRLGEFCGALLVPTTSSTAARLFVLTKTSFIFYEQGYSIKTTIIPVKLSYTYSVPPFLWFLLLNFLSCFEHIYVSVF